MPSSFQIGIATVDITPPVGATLVGYKDRTAASVSDRLRAECLYCAGEGGSWLLIDGDFIGAPRVFTDRVRGKISARTKVPAGAILIAGTHTHSGPKTISLDTTELGEVDRKYLAEFEAKLVELAAAAVADAGPGSFEITTTTARELMSNRRIQQPDGVWVNEWQDFEGKHSGYADPTVMIATVKREGGKREAILVNYGCHPVVLGPGSLTISGDYAGHMKAALEAGGKRTAIFVLAPCGNINPRVCIMDNVEPAKTMGTALAGIVSDAAGKAAQRVTSGRVAGASVEWPIVRTRDAMRTPGAPGRTAGQTFSTLITALAAGDVCFVGLPGEPFSEFGEMIREKSPFRHTFVVALAQDYPGYFPTDEGQKQGAYEARMAPADELEKPLVEHAVKAMKAVSARA